MGEKKRVSDEYVNNMADNAMNDHQQENGWKSPIETVFKLNLRNGLLEFEKHYEMLNNEKDSFI
jgi:hypothetical protein